MGSADPLLATSGPAPADALAQLGGLPLVLAAVEPRLERREQDHHDREERHDAEREEGDDPVVGLADQALAVVGGEEREFAQQAHTESTIPCRTAWPTSRSSASWRSRRGAGTSTSSTTSATSSSSIASCSRPSSTRPTMASCRTRSRSTE